MSTVLMTRTEQDANGRGTAQLLRTPDYTIFPYARGLWYPPATLYAVYTAMVADRSLYRVLYEAQRLDLEAFMAYFTGAALYLAVAPDNDTLLAAVWFTAVTDHKAQIGIWAARQARGILAQRIVAHVIQFAFALYHWQTIWGLTPWRAALDLGLRIGFVHVATVPGFITTGRGKTLPMYVVRKDAVRYVYDC